MKKLLLLLALNSIYVCSYAQSAFGVKAGVNLATMSLDMDDFGDQVDKTLTPVISASLLGHIELSYAANLTIELGLVQTGAKIKAEDDFLKETINNIRFSPGIAFNVSDQFLIGFSPYVAYAMNGKYEEKADGVTTSETIKGSDFDDEMKVDYGLNCNLNFISNSGFLVSAGYSLGIKDFNAYYNEEYNDNLDPLRNSGIMISIGYLFGY